jgi:hypothetical protein
VRHGAEHVGNRLSPARPSVISSETKTTPRTVSLVVRTRSAGRQQWRDRIAGGQAWNDPAAALRPARRADAPTSSSGTPSCSRRREEALRCSSRTTRRSRSPTCSCLGGGSGDGVFAISVTPLVLEIKPSTDTRNLLHGPVAFWPSYLAYPYVPVHRAGLGQPPRDGRPHPCSRPGRTALACLLQRGLGDGI